MKINRENYEAYLLDLAEGRLSAGMERELNEFLRINPDLDADIDLSITSLPLSGEFFPDKESLKKGGAGRVVNENNFEQFCIARMEGDLSGEAEKALDDFLSNHPGYTREASIYQLLVLKADQGVVYTGKSKLKKIALRQDTPLSFRRILYPAVSVAASVAVILSAWLFLENFMGRDRQLNNVVAELEPDEAVEQRTFSGDTGIVPALPDAEMIDQINGDIIAYETNIEHRIIEVSDEYRTPVRIQPLPRTMPLPVAYQRPHRDIRLEASDALLALKPLQVESGLAKPSEHRGSERVFGNLTAFFSRMLDEERESERLSIAGLAAAGLKGLNTLTGTQVSFEREFDEEGQLVYMAFSSALLEFRRTVSSDD